MPEHGSAPAHDRPQSPMIPAQSVEPSTPPSKWVGPFGPAPTPTITADRRFYEAYTHVQVAMEFDFFEETVFHDGSSLQMAPRFKQSLVCQCGSHIVVKCFLFKTVCAALPSHKHHLTTFALQVSGHTQMCKWMRRERREGRKGLVLACEPSDDYMVDDADGEGRYLSTRKRMLKGLAYEVVCKHCQPWQRIRVTTPDDQRSVAALQSLHDKEVDALDMRQLYTSREAYLRSLPA